MATFSKQKVQSVNQTICQEYPDFKNIYPKVTETSDGNAVLVYEKKEKTADGIPIKLVLRVTVDANGRILKVSTSR
jgi:hypothetical protein